MTQDVVFSKGLEGVIASESRICRVDGELGRLYYYGYPIEDLVRHSTYEEVAYLLLFGKLPTASQMEHFQDKMLKYRRLHGSILRILKSLSADTHPMKALQTGLSALGGIWDNKTHTNASETLMAYISQVPLLVAAYYRIMNGLEVVDPDINLSYAGNFLYMIHGKPPTAEHTAIFDKVLILHAEHDFCASTFTARVVASTLAPVSCVLSAAVGALYGPLHGGANEGALKMVEEIGSPDNVAAYVGKAMAEKKKVDGMGHRVYKVKDPRAIIIQGILRDMTKEPHAETLFRTLERLEEHFVGLMVAKGKSIYPNVDFYSGTLLRILGLSPILYTCIFATSRVTGWSAHINEQWADNRIYRPLSHFVGELGRPYVPIADRA